MDHSGGGNLANYYLLHVSVDAALLKTCPSNKEKKYYAI